MGTNLRSAGPLCSDQRQAAENPHRGGRNSSLALAAAGAVVCVGRGQALASDVHPVSFRRRCGVVVKRRYGAEATDRRSSRPRPLRGWTPSNVVPRRASARPKTDPIIRRRNADQADGGSSSTRSGRDSARQQTRARWPPDELAQRAVR